MSVVIYGAGISGLFLGLFLKKKGMDFTIYEQSSKTGGKLGTLHTPFGPVEQAANGLLYSDLLQEVCDDLQLPILFSRPKLQRLVQRRQQSALQKAPALSSYEMLRILTKIATNPTMDDPRQSSVKDFLTPLTGENFVDEVISTALGGIYASSAEQLHLGSLLQELKPGESYLRYFLRYKKNNRNKYFPHHKARTSTVSFSKGMGELVQTLTHFLKDHIVYQKLSPLKTEGTITFLCMPPKDVISWLEVNTSAIPATASEALKQYLKSITMLPITTTTIFTNTPLHQLDNAFGVLFSRKTQRHHLGILNNSAIFDDRTISKQHFSYTFISSQQTDKPLTLITEDIQKMDPQWKEESIQAHYSFHYPEGIPLYDTSRVLAWNKYSPLFPPNLQLFTNYTHKIGLRDILHQAKAIVESLPTNNPAP